MVDKKTLEMCIRDRVQNQLKGFDLIWLMN